MKNVREKGKSHERKVAALLSGWAGEKFMRTPGSGNIRHFNDKRVVSDIVAPLSIGKFPFSIECKNVEYPWELNTYIEEKSLFFQHWKQATDDADREGLEPMLLFTKNYRDIFMVVNADTFKKLEEIGGKVTYNNVEIHSNLIGEIVVMKFTEFLEQYKLEHIQKLAEIILK